jgi:hypothetical protein
VPSARIAGLVTNQPAERGVPSHPPGMFVVTGADTEPAASRLAGALRMLPDNPSNMTCPLPRLPESVLHAKLTPRLCLAWSGLDGVRQDEVRHDAVGEVDAVRGDVATLQWPDMDEILVAYCRAAGAPFSALADVTA